MKLFLSAFLFIFVWPLHGCEERNDIVKKLRRSVFKIRSQSQEPNYLVPWQREQTSSGSGTGFYIGDNRIMTNAHVVANSKFITVQRDGDAEKMNARVEYIAHDCDLAILSVDQPEKLGKTETMEFGGLPRLQTPVSTIGYPTGGDQVSITQGIVSRIDFRRYAHSGYLEHLLIQVDSAINPGNSGGPVVQGKHVVGVAFQAYTAAENTGYIIPSAVIRRFLKDIEDGTYDGHPTNEVISYSELLANASMRAYYGLDKEKGVLITQTPEHSPFNGVLEEEDVVLKVDQYEVGSDGKIDFQGERVTFEVIYDLLQIGEKLKFSVLRNNEVKTVEVVAKKDNEHYYAGDVFTPYPRYLSHGGFVFTSLSRNLLKSWGKGWFRKAPTPLRYFHYMGMLDEDTNGHDEYIVLAKKMNAPINQYILMTNYQVVKTVNGKRPRDMIEFKSLLKEDVGDFTTIEFYFNDSKIILPHALGEMNDKINTHYSIEPDEWLGDYSRDMTTEWKMNADKKM